MPTTHALSQATATVRQATIATVRQAVLARATLLAVHSAEAAVRVAVVSLAVEAIQAEVLAEVVDVDKKLLT